MCSSDLTWQACRAYGYALGQACDRAHHARSLRKDAAGAILYLAEKATWMAGEAIQTLGGNGYINEYPVGRLWRDAKLYEIGAGTREIRRMLIGRAHILRRYCPPTSNSALVICPSEQTRTASISTSNTLRFSITACCRRLSMAGDSLA